MRAELVPGSVKRLVNVWRDFNPLPGEKSPTKIAVQSYGQGTWAPLTVAVAFVDTPKLQQFLVDEGPPGDRLLAALKTGPVKPEMYGDSWLIDLDRVKRA